MRKYLLFILLVGLIAEIDTAAAAGLPGAAAWTAGAGYIIPLHEFSAQLVPGFTAAAGALYPLEGIYPGLAAEAELRFSRWGLESSADSSLMAVSLGAGPLMFFPFPAGLPVSPYGGLSLQGSYLRLNAEKIGETHSAFRPGIVAKAGVVTEFFEGTGLRAGVDYGALPLSGRLFGALNLSVSAVFNYGALSWGTGFHGSETAPGTDLLMVKAKKELEAGNNRRARELFSRVPRKDKNHEEAGKYLSHIARIEEFYARALGLLKEGRHLEALPLLKSAVPGIGDAAVELGKTRELLKANVPAWEKAGIAEYEKMNYDGCIQYMERVILVDPDNRTAGIYLPRAKKRKQALEKLK